MIKVYGKVNCSKCQLLKNILDEKNVNYEYIDDLKTLMMVASKARIMSAPIVEKDEKIYTMEQFLEVL
ncbi:glutaredoxin domain-containing protein [uncultured Fusobacterium sp.]|uniref:glutaredoxin family protein n=1 Tax=uncultured Fusobacterium sp. TaxID=159267 RepID=UPI0025F712AA|nr:glutaredoxin domain-containing protein [uncultured Fusobacterium sp.]